MVPTRWVKFVAGVLLLPVCWVLSRTFFDEFTRVAVTHRFWATEEFYFFALGATLWSLAFVILPRPLIVYVFGHEATHALWVWLQLGEVSAFRVGREGGYIVADRRDFLVSLAPYFFPLYSIVAIAAFGAAGHFYPWLWESPHRRWLFGAIGATWAFHATFTCWMILQRQTDLLLHGTFFSLVVIYLANLCVLFLLLIVACPTMHWTACGRELLGNAADFSFTARENAVWLWQTFHD